MFQNDLSEFDDARSEIADLIAEYEAAESANYLDGPVASADRGGNGERDLRERERGVADE